MSDFDWTTQSPEELAKAYIKSREVKAELNKRIDKLEEMQKAIQAAMLHHMNETGTTGFKVPGVASVSITSKQVFACADWVTFRNWAITQIDHARKTGGDPTEIFSFLQSRLSSTAIKDYMEVNDGVVPPAVNVLTEQTVSVRAAKS